MQSDQWLIYDPVRMLTSLVVQGGGTRMLGQACTQASDQGVDRRAGRRMNTQESSDGMGEVGRMKRQRLGGDTR